MSIRVQMRSVTDHFCRPIAMFTIFLAFCKVMKVDGAEVSLVMGISMAR